MAITGTSRGTATFAGTAATTFAFSPASNFSGTTGSWAVCHVSLNNTGTGGAAYGTLTLTDSLGNTWTRRQSPIADPGSTNQGVEGAIFTTPMNGGVIQTSTVITVTTDIACARHAVSIEEITPTSGSTLSYVTGGVSSAQNTSTPTITTGSITSGNLVSCGCFYEYGSPAAGDSDTTNGSWSTMQNPDAGVTEAGVGLVSQRKVVTATATQTYNVDIFDVTDCVMAWIEITETASGNRRRRVLMAS